MRRAKGMMRVGKGYEQEEWFVSLPLKKLDGPIGNPTVVMKLMGNGGCETLVKIGRGRIDGVGRPPGDDDPANSRNDLL